mgnify:CR=1 FL=1
MTAQITLAIAQVFGVGAIGWLAARLGYIRQEDITRWSRLMTDFLYPLLVFHSIVRGFQPERFRELWVLPAIGLGMVLVGALSGVLLRAGVRSRDPEIIRTFHHFCASNNYTFLPVLIVAALWGETGLADLFVLNLGSALGYWTIGVALLGGADRRQTIRNILSPMLVAIALALALSLLGIAPHMPAVVLRICEAGGAAAVPGMLMIGGATLYPSPKFEHRWDLFWLSVCRLALIPALLLGILKVLPISTETRNVAAIVALMPVPISSTVLTRRFGGAPRFAAQAAVVTTLAAAVTVPLAVLLIRGTVLR